MWRGWVEVVVVRGGIRDPLEMVGIEPVTFCMGGESSPLPPLRKWLLPFCADIG